MSNILNKVSFLKKEGYELDQILNVRLIESFMEQGHVPARAELDPILRRQYGNSLSPISSRYLEDIIIANVAVLIRSKRYDKHRFIVEMVDALEKCFVENY